eukprot:4033408-Pleurochrysis_carterae.AAC.1
MKANSSNENRRSREREVAVQEKEGTEEGSHMGDRNNKLLNAKLQGIYPCNRTIGRERDDDRESRLLLAALSTQSQQRPSEDQKDEKLLSFGRRRGRMGGGRRKDSSRRGHGFRGRSHASLSILHLAHLQMMMDSSSEAEARTLPSQDQRTQLTAPLWPLSTDSSLGFVESCSAACTNSASLQVIRVAQQVRARSSSPLRVMLYRSTTPLLGRAVECQARLCPRRRKPTTNAIHELDRFN